MAKRLDADVCSLYLGGADLDCLTLRATVGLRRDAVGNVVLRLDQGLVGLAAERKQPVVIERANDHPRFKYFPETGEERFESFMAAPLIVRGRPLGVLAVQTVEARRFEQGDVETLVTCAQLLMPVVLNAELIDAAGLPLAEEQQAADDELMAQHGVPLVGAKPARESEGVELAGIATARGIAIGPVVKLGQMDLARMEYTPSTDVEQEERNLMQAVQDARRELDTTRDEMGEQFGPDFRAVFHTHIQILEDKGFLAKLKQAVHANCDGLAALRDVLAVYRKQF